MCLFCVWVHTCWQGLCVQGHNKRFMQPQNWMSDGMCQNKYQNGAHRRGITLGSPLPVQPKETELQRLIKQRSSQQRHWHTMAASYMTRHINYTSSLITAALMLFIILNTPFTDPHALWCHCSVQSAVSLLIHTAAVIHCGRTHKATLLFSFVQWSC